MRLNIEMNPNHKLADNIPLFQDYKLHRIFEYGIDAICILSNKTHNIFLSLRYDIECGWNVMTITKPTKIINKRSVKFPYKIFKNTGYSTLGTEENKANEMVYTLVDEDVKHIIFCFFHNCDKQQWNMKAMSEPVKFCNFFDLENNDQINDFLKNA